MRLRYFTMCLLLAATLTASLIACRKTTDCSNSSANLQPPVPEARFRIIDEDGRDLLASITPGNLSFDSLVASQPCNISNVLGKKKIQTGAGGLESYVFYFDGLHQPVTGENQECFQVYLNWGAGNVDTIEFKCRTEHHVCGITYYLDAVMFNGKEAKKDANGNYLLQQ